MRLALIVSTLAIALPLQAEELRGKVAMVAEGDLITVTTADSTMTVRLQAIDCPEPDQPFGDKARQLAAKLVLGKKVTVSLSGAQARGRPLARVCQESRCLDEELLRAGLAWCEKSGDGRRGAPMGCSAELRRLEQQARAAKRGLWAEARPVPPWEWRKSHAAPKPGAGSGGFPTVDITHSVCVDLRTRQAHWYQCPQARGLACQYDDAWQARSAGFGLHSCLGDQPAPPAPAPKPSPASDERACKRDSDCTFRPPRRCGCPPCGAQRRQAINTRTTEKLRREEESIKCGAVACARCPAPLRWLGTRAVCSRGQCDVR
jgi:micrococcal nuclease